MKLPNRNKAVIPSEKITNYLLSQSHAVGKYKANFFQKIGFKEEDAGELTQSLANIAANHEVSQSVIGLHGTKYIIHGVLQSPTGISARIVTVWIIEQGQENPRFITAYPE